MLTILVTTGELSLQNQLDTLKKKTEVENRKRKKENEALRRELWNKPRSISEAQHVGKDVLKEATTDLAYFENVLKSKP